MRHRALGSYLKERRSNINMSQTELAKKLKINRQFVSNWERGVCPAPKPAVRKMIKLLSLDWHSFSLFMANDYRFHLQREAHKYGFAKQSVRNK
jgi:transcriptional regulator with XRE-family HTH domain